MPGGYFYPPMPVNVAKKTVAGTRVNTCVFLAASVDILLIKTDIPTFQNEKEGSGAAFEAPKTTRGKGMWRGCPPPQGTRGSRGAS